MRIFRPNKAFYIANLFLLTYCWGISTIANAVEFEGITASDVPQTVRACICNWVSAGVAAGQPLPSVETSFFLRMDNKKKVIAKPPLTIPAGEKPSCSKVREEGRKINAMVFQRIIEQVKNQTETVKLDKTLIDIVKRIEESRSADGTLPDSEVIASPNQVHAVLNLRYFPLIVVDVSTLKIQILTNAKTYLDTPVAWSSDSQFLAYARPDTDKLVIYNVEQRAMVSSKTGIGKWVAALSWSPNRQQIAAVEFHNRRMHKNPLALLSAAAGHPDFSVDAKLGVYEVQTEQRILVMLKKGIHEYFLPDVAIEWK